MQGLLDHDQITLILPLPISVNKAFAGNGKIRYKSGDYKAWILAAAACMRNYPNYQITGDKWLSVTYVFYMPTVCKNGNKRVVDVANREKALSDFLSWNEKKQAGIK